MGLAVVGQTNMMLELGNDRAVQLFAPYNVSRMMARTNIGDGNPFIDRGGFVNIGEPACGAGGMVIACADALDDAGSVTRAMTVSALPRCLARRRSLLKTACSSWCPMATVLLMV